MPDKDQPQQGVSAKGEAGSLQARIHQPLPAGHEQYAVIGQVAAGWSMVEHILDLIIWDAARMPQTLGACVTSEVRSTYSKCNVILALCHSRGFPQELVAEIKRFKEKCQGTGEKRNRIVHDPWYLEKGTQNTAQFQSTNTPKRKYGMKDVEKAFVDGVLAEIAERSSEAQAIRNTVLGLLGS